MRRNTSYSPTTDTVVLVYIIFFMVILILLAVNIPFVIKNLIVAIECILLIIYIGLTILV